MNKNFARLSGFLILAAYSQIGHAVDGYSLAYGKSDSSNANVSVVRAALQWNWERKFFTAGDWNVGGHWEASIALWDNNSTLKTNSGLMDISLSPVMRLQQNKPGNVAPYFEGSVGGISLLSKTSVSTERNFGSSLQFNSHIGAGIRFGAKGAYDLSYRYQYISNAGLKAQNQGINFSQLRFGYHS